MLRCNYSTEEHVTALIKLFRPSLVTRDTRFRLKERVFYFIKKSSSFLCHFFANLLKNCFIIIPMLRCNYSTGEHVTALIKLFRPSLVGTRYTRFTFKEPILFSLKKYFSVNFVIICLKTLHYNTNVETQLQYW